jgi:hypothetical protein
MEGKNSLETNLKDINAEKIFLEQKNSQLERSLKQAIDQVRTMMVSFI